MAKLFLSELLYFGTHPPQQGVEQIDYIFEIVLKRVLGESKTIYLNIFLIPKIYSLKTCVQNKLIVLLKSIWERPFVVRRRCGHCTAFSNRRVEERDQHHSQMRIRSFRTMLASLLNSPMETQHRSEAANEHFRGVFVSFLNSKSWKSCAMPESPPNHKRSVSNRFKQYDGFILCTIFQAVKCQKMHPEQHTPPPRSSVPVGRFCLGDFFRGGTLKCTET